MKLNKTLTIRVSEAVRKQLEVLAKDTSRSVGWLIRAAITQYLERYGKSADK